MGDSISTHNIYIYICMARGLRRIWKCFEVSPTSCFPCLSPVTLSGPTSCAPPPFLLCRSPTTIQIPQPPTYKNPIQKRVNFFSSFILFLSFNLDVLKKKAFVQTNPIYSKILSFVNGFKGVALSALHSTRIGSWTLPGHLSFLLL